MLLCNYRCSEHFLYFFSWQDAADAESSSGEKSVLYLLLKMFVSSISNSHLRSSTQKLVLKVKSISISLFHCAVALSLHFM